MIGRNSQSEVPFVEKGSGGTIQRILLAASEAQGKFRPEPS